MPGNKGRARRRNGIGAEVVELKVRVLEAHREKAYGISAALGISTAAYIDELLAREELDEHGRPVWWTDPVPADQQSLPVG